jgi:hypothetical protein
MNRRAALGLAAALAGPVTLSGCATDGTSPYLPLKADLVRLLGWDDDPVERRHDVTPASLAVAERVETMGRRVIALNTFTGLDPLFHTIGKPEPELFHRGTAQLFISEGLVKRCQTDAELAAVLCTELGAMMAEQRAAGASGRDGDGIQTVGGTQAGTEVGASAARPRTAEPPADPAELARGLLRGAGFDPAELDRVRPILAGVARGGALEKQVAGSAAAPTWEK